MKNAYLSFWLEPELKERFRRFCDERKVDAAFLMRSLIYSLLDNPDDWNIGIQKKKEVEE